MLSRTYLHVVSSLIPRWHVPQDVGTHIYIYCKKARLVYQSHWWRALLKSKWNWLDHMTSPFLRLYYIVTIYYTITWGCGCGSALQSKSMDGPGQQFLDLLDQAVLVPCRAWLDLCGCTGVCMGHHRLWCWGILLDSWHGKEQLESGSSELPVVAGAVDVGCMHGAGVGDAGCAAKKRWLDRACSVAVVPLGTVSAALTLCSWRCLHVWQYVEPLLVHTR